MLGIASVLDAGSGGPVLEDCLHLGRVLKLGGCDCQNLCHCGTFIMISTHLSALDPLSIMDIVDPDLSIIL